MSTLTDATLADFRRLADRYTGATGSDQSWLAHQLAMQAPKLLAEVERLRAVNTAGENLADAVEDLLFTEGEHRQRVRDAWQRYVEVADTRAAVSTPDGTPTGG